MCICRVTRTTADKYSHERGHLVQVICGRSSVRVGVSAGILHIHSLAFSNKLWSIIDSMDDVVFASLDDNAKIATWRLPEIEPGLFNKFIGYLGGDHLFMEVSSITISDVKYQLNQLACLGHILAMQNFSTWSWYGIGSFSLIAKGRGPHTSWNCWLAAHRTRRLPHERWC